MKIKEIINKNFCVDSRLLKRNDVFFDFLSNSKKINPFLKSIIKKKTKFNFFIYKSKLSQLNYF